MDDDERRRAWEALRRISNPKTLFCRFLFHQLVCNLPDTEMEELLRDHPLAYLADEIDRNSSFADIIYGQPNQPLEEPVISEEPNRDSSPAVLSNNLDGNETSLDPVVVISSNDWFVDDTPDQSNTILIEGGPDIESNPILNQISPDDNVINTIPDQRLDNLFEHPSTISANIRASMPARIHSMPSISTERSSLPGNLHEGAHQVQKPPGFYADCSTERWTSNRKQVS